jgi:hypothetical protein
MEKKSMKGTADARMRRYTAYSSLKVVYALPDMFGYPDGFPATTIGRSRGKNTFVSF